jgi:hypothetical protein
VPPGRRHNVLCAAALAALLLGPFPASAQLQSDCRAAGTIGNAVMASDGTITLTLTAPDGTQAALAYRKGDPNYARMLSHVGGMRPGQHKPVPAFC